MGIDEEVLAMAEKQNMIPNDVVQVDLDLNEIARRSARNLQRTWFYLREIRILPKLGALREEALNASKMRAQRKEKLHTI